MARRDSGGFDFDAADDEVEAVIAAETEESEPIEAAAATAVSHKIIFHSNVTVHLWI